MPQPKKRAPRGSIAATNRPLYLDAESLAAWEWLGDNDVPRQAKIREYIVALARQCGRQVTASEG